ncbi:hypothetical protein POTOM_007465 [Populus tomentosa]|uniref:Uncharacterized protein n=1 Tax=Populus tomentosa TaxID=118781 RepID=A0A8X8A6U7_POPTO|nr:hypothetical protein POTOM_009560 [Populus tomentosa]KAG6785874.1 hypothetical protein POTOM_007465 [Populus tomentosa]
MLCCSVSYGEVFYSPSTKTVSMNEYLSSRASGTIKDKIRRSLEINLRFSPVYFGPLVSIYLNWKMIQHFLPSNYAERT